MWSSEAVLSPDNIVWHLSPAHNKWFRLEGIEGVAVDPRESPPEGSVALSVAGRGETLAAQVERAVKARAAASASAGAAELRLPDLRIPVRCEAVGVGSLRG